MKKVNGADILAKILSTYNLNPKSFSEKIGLKRAQAIYDIQHGKTERISPNIASKILSVYPEINRVWLLTGDGEMLVPESSNNDPPPEKKHTEMEERLMKLLEQSAKEKERLLEIIDTLNRQISDLKADRKIGGGILSP